MAEQILPPNLAALLRLPPEALQQLMASSGGQTPPGPSPMAAALRSGELGQPPVDMSGPSVMGPMSGGPLPPMPPTLSGAENPPEITREPFRPRGRVIAQTLGAVGGGMGGGAVGGPPGAIAGGGMGSAGAGQLYDAAADYLMGTQERAPVLSGQTAIDAAAGAIPAAGPAIGAGMRAAGRGASEVASAAMSQPTMASALASGALGGAGMAATSGQTQEVEIPAQFRPMDQDEYNRRNRRTGKSLADLQTEAEERVTRNPAYQGLIEDRQTTRARRMIDEARANAKKTFDDQKADLSGEDARLEEAYKKYKEGLKADLDQHFSTRAGEEQAAKDRLANTPFRQRYPNLSGALPYAGMGVAAGIPFAGRGISNAITWGPRSASRQFDAATARAEGATNASNMRDFNMAAGEIRNSLSARPQSMLDQSTLRDAARVGAKNMTPYATSGLAGGALFAEANMLPYQWDALNLPPGAAQSEARSNALDVPQYLERGAMGSLGGASGYKAANILIPRRQPNWARGEAAANNPPGSGPNRPNNPNPNPAGPLSAAEIGTRRRADGPLPGGHYVDPAAPPTPGEIWASPKGNKMWTRDDNGRFRDEAGQLMTDPRTNRRDWRRLSSADDAAQSGGMAEFLKG